MLFSAIARPNDSGIESQEKEKLLQSGIEALERDPRVESFYWFDDNSGGIVVFEARSGEELQRTLDSNPLGKLTRWEVHGLVDPDSILSSGDGRRDGTGATRATEKRPAEKKAPEKRPPLGVDGARETARISPIQVQKHLGGVDYPVDKATLLDTAKREGADENMMGWLERLPNGSFDSPM